MSYFHTFESICYAHVLKHNQTKLDPKVKKCIFVGYDTHRKGWRCMDLETKLVTVSRDVVADEGDKFEDSLVGEREQGNGMDDKNSLESLVQLNDECKESKGIDQEGKTRNFNVSDKEVEKEMSDVETTKTTPALTQNFRDKGKRVAETSKNKKKKKSERIALEEDDLDKILAELREGLTISKSVDSPLSSQEAKVENPPDLVTPSDASAEKEAEEESTETATAGKKRKRKKKEREKEKLLKKKQDGKLLTGNKVKFEVFRKALGVGNKLALKEALRI